MKKTLLAGLAVMGLTLGSYAQGTVNFGNVSGVTGRVYTNTIAIGGASGLATTNGFAYTVGLYWGAASSSEGQLVQIASGAANFTAGRFTLGNATTGLGTAAGDTGVFQVRGWTGNFATYEAAYAAAIANPAAGILLGATTVFNNATGGAGSPPSLPTNLSGWLAANPLTLTPVPEPSTIALAGLGAASLLLFRRRK